MIWDGVYDDDRITIQTARIEGHLKLITKNANDFKDKKCSHHLFVARGEGYSMFSQVWEKHMRACRNNWDKLWHMHKSLSSQRKMNGCFIWMICSNVSAFQKYSITQTTKMLFIGFSRWENSLNVQEFTEKSLASCAHGAGINQTPRLLASTVIEFEKILRLREMYPIAVSRSWLDCVSHRLVDPSDRFLLKLTPPSQKSWIWWK